MQIITDQEIREDIESFEKRIAAAQAKLNMLPGGYLPYTEHKKRELQQRLLEDEIRHAEGLIKIATEALSGYTWG